MAENDKCIKRWAWSEVCGEDFHDTFIDHHEWRFLRQGIVYKDTPTPNAVYDVYYCVFCLITKSR